MAQRTSVVCIFAHPDDESFGPSGTIAKLAQTQDVYVICATRGEAGENHRSAEPRLLAEMREEELKASAKILGVKEVHFLDFIDGTLCNNMYHEIAKRVEEYLEKIKPETLLTYEVRGVSGHIDHITMSMITTFLFEKLPYVKKLMYHCLTEEQRKTIENYFIYFPPGYKRSEIDEIVDISSTFDLKIQAIHAHLTQEKDGHRILKRLAAAPKEEYFLVKYKQSSSRQKIY
jgi:LmbE family N-acetylglucosaminyl deacetylase